jgi:glutamine amidotransferase
VIVVVDYKMGNVGSVLNMLKKIGTQAVLSSSPDVVASADKVILPGVGAFDTGMRNIEALGLRPVLDRKVMELGTPVLGICLGMQLLTERSEEGALPGLGWIRGETVRFRFDGSDSRLKVPHMGWNEVRVLRGDGIFRGLADEQDTAFYFVHSFHVVCREPTDVLARTHHGYEFDAAVQRGNVIGTQFHPEKSHRFGMKLLRNFVEG